jgi:superfamily II DNA/RNA helicase
MSEICLDEIKARRALIFTDGLMTMWNTEGFLTNLRFNVESLRSNLDASERKQIIDDFNDPNKKL